jgi:hypothetical protein
MKTEGYIDSAYLIYLIRMELPNFPLNLKVQLGEEEKDNQQTLAHIHVANYGPSEVINFL